MTETTCLQCGAVGIPEHGETHHPDGNVTLIGATVVRGEVWPEPNDSEGKSHHHGAVASIPYLCPAGHDWAVRMSLGCWCGWPNAKETAP